MADTSRMNGNTFPNPKPEESTLPPPSHTLPGMPESPNLPPKAADDNLTRAARNAGSALGSTVSRFRAGLTLVRKPAGEGSVTERLSDTAGEYSAAASRRVRNMKRSVQERGEHLADAVQASAAELGEDARRRVRQLRSESQRLQREYPIQVILGFAAAAFVLGFTLRLWRSTHD